LLSYTGVRRALNPPLIYHYIYFFFAKMGIGSARTNPL